MRKPCHLLQGLGRAWCALATVCGMLVSTPAISQSLRDDKVIVVTLLGTGTPNHSDGRRGFSNLIQAGGLNLLIDAGRGSVISLGEMRIPVGRIDATFITHYHSDHVNGIPDLFLTGYIASPTLGGRKTAFQLYGPEGIEQLARGIEMAYEADAKIRLADEPQTAKEATRIHAHTIKEGVVFDKSGVKLSAFTVDHGDLIKPTVGYRIDYAGRSVVFPSDTKFDENVIKHAQDVDLLVHEVFFADPETREQPNYKAILAHHTSPEEVATVFRRAKPKLAVLSHYTGLPGPRGIPSNVELDLRIRAAGYEGPLLMSEDMMQFRVSEKGVTVMRAGR